MQKVTHEEVFKEARSILRTIWHRHGDRSRWRQVVVIKHARNVLKTAED